MSEWKPWRKWYMDVFKNVLTFGIITVLTLIALNRLEEDRIRLRFREQARFSERDGAARDLARSSLAFLQTSRWAFEEMGRLASRADTAIGSQMQRYRGAWLDHWIALDRTGNLITERRAADCLLVLRDRSQTHNGLYEEAHNTFMDLDTLNDNGPQRVARLLEVVSTVDFQRSAELLDDQRRMCDATLQSVLYGP